MRSCEYCGAPLEDGQLCTCPQAQQKRAEQPAPLEPNQEPPQQTAPEQPEPQEYGYGQAEENQPPRQEPSQPGYNYQAEGPGGQPAGGYDYQQPGQDPSQPGYRYQPNGAGGQPSGGYGYQQQPDSYGYQPGVGAQNQGQSGGFSAQQTQQQFAQMGKQVRDTTVHAAKSLKPFFTQYWTSPIQAVRTAVAEKNLTLAVTLTVIRAVVVIALLWNLVGQVAGMLRGSFGALGTLSSMLGGSAAMTVKGNPLGSILFGLIIAVVGMALFTLVFFVLTRLFKSGGSILDLYIANSANGGVTTGVLLLAFVCSFFSVNLALGLVLLACFSAVIFGGLTLQAVCPDRSSGAFWLCYLAGIVVVLAVSWWIIPPCVMQAVGGITLSMNGESITLGKILDQVLSGGLSKIFSGLFNSLLY